ncbi:MAG: hypothetical protein RL291_70 [Pseudomonadota bacterium]|jgi:hypothetical protein
MPAGPLTWPGPWRVTRVRWRIGPLVRVSLRREWVENYPAPGYPKHVGAEVARGWRLVWK